MLDNLIHWDKQFFVLLNGLGTATFDAFWIGYTHLPNWILLYLLIIGLLFRAFSWKQALTACLTIALLMAALNGLTDWVKLAAGRIRPSNEPELRGMIRVLSRPSDFSFFSGHSSFAFALSTLAVLFLRKRYRWVHLFFLWAVFMAFSRIYIGVHYPGDVLIGALVGALAAFLCYKLFWRLSKQYRP